MDTKMTDDILDAAAADALGMNAGVAVAEAERDLRETVARLSAAAPYMAPPAALRGRILQATAPATFRMEDYRKATREQSPIYKWGFYAAAFFLIAAAWFNINAKNSNALLTSQLQQTVAQANEKLQSAQQRIQVVQSALATIAAPKADVIRFVNEKQETVARALVDHDTGKAVVIAPEGFFPPNAQLTLTKDDKAITYNTTFLLTPPGAMKVPSIAAKPSLNEKELTPDTDSSNKVYQADMGISP